MKAEGPQASCLWGPAGFQPAENLQGNLAAETQGLGSEALFVINLTRPGQTPGYPTARCLCHTT